MGLRLWWSNFMDLQWDMNTWNSHLASSCWSGASLHLPLRSFLQWEAVSGGWHFIQWTQIIVCKLSMWMCRCVCVVSISLWTRRERNSCENIWGIRKWCCLPPKRWDLHTAQSPDTQHSCAKTNMHMHAIMHTHSNKGLSHLHSLHHRFQIVSSSVSHFTS